MSGERIRGRDLLNLDLRNVKMRNVSINKIKTKINTQRANIVELYNMIGDKDVILNNTRFRVREGNLSIGDKYFPLLAITIMKYGNSYENLMEIYKLCNVMRYKLSIKLITKDNNIYYLKNIY